MLFLDDEQSFLNPGFVIVVVVVVVGSRQPELGAELSTLLSKQASTSTQIVAKGLTQNDNFG